MKLNYVMIGINGRYSGFSDFGRHFRFLHFRKRFAFCLGVIASVSFLIREPLSDGASDRLAGAFGVVDAKRHAFVVSIIEFRH